MHRLDNEVKHYDWGSRSAIAAFLRRPASTEPEAELWMGAHPLAPSRVVEADRSLEQCIADDPMGWLGPGAAGYGNRLPFLLKILAAERPLSLQAHPNREQAREGFLAEERAGVSRTDPRRTYKDDNHKPELLCALSPFTALCGFRAPSETAALFAAIGTPVLRGLAADLRRESGPHGLRRAFEQILRTPQHEAPGFVARVLEALDAAPDLPAFASSLRWARTLAAQYPGDVGVVASLMLNVLELKPGEAVFLPGGNLHAYLEGVGVEIMASSDNVLRGGLTSKHVDVDELLRVLAFAGSPVTPTLPRPEGVELVYDTPASEFRLSRITGGEPQEVAATLGVWGPEILVCEQGRWEAEDDVSQVVLTPGQSVFVRGSTQRYRVRGSGSLFRATVGEIPEVA